MPQTKRTVKGVLGGLLGLVGLSAVAGVLATAAVTPAIAIAGVTGSQALSIFDELPNSLTPGTPMEPTVFYGTGTDGKPFQLAKFYDQNRVPVTFDQVSPLLYDAILSSEDKNFYSHGGVNLGATASALLDYVRGTSSRGASTISQQFVKNVLIQECEKNASPSEDDYEEKLRACWVEATEASGAEGIERKLQEMRYAIQIEKDYSKNDILLGYLNIANFGGQTYGIEAAANYYFGTTAAKLNLNQAATLAGIVQNPNRYRIDKPGGTGTDAEGNPTNGKDDGYAATKTRRDYVIKRMFVDGKITEEQRDEAYAAPITPKITPTTQGCAGAGDQAYFCQYVRKVVETDKAFGETSRDRQETLKRGGLQIYTSLDMRIQGPAVKAMRDRVPANYDSKYFGGSGVTVEPGTGRILAITQNTTFRETPSEDQAYTSLVFASDPVHGGFPVGSAYKLFTLIDWLEKGHSVNETINGRNRTLHMTASCTGLSNDFNTADVGNFGGSAGYYGTPMRFTRDSLNSGYFAMASQLDICDINKAADRMGVRIGDGKGKTTDSNQIYDVLGSKFISPLDMAGAYATVANKGIHCTPKAIDKIIGADGKELPLPKSTCTQVISPEVAATAAYALQGVMTPGGTGSGANPYDGTPLLGKTGSHQVSSTMMIESSTKATTAVYIGRWKDISKNESIWGRWYNGMLLQNIRYAVARDMQAAANAVLGGGDRFPEPDRNLTRQVLKDLPDVVGKSVDEATDILRGAGFSVQVGDPVDSEMEAGLVAQQSPGAGRAPGGTTVTISPSTGKSPEAAVPNVTGAKFGQAKSALEKAGFAVSGDECSGGDTVTAQSPAGDGTAPPGSTITLTCEKKEDD